MNNIKKVEDKVYKNLRDNLKMNIKKIIIQKLNIYGIKLHLKLNMMMLFLI